MKRFVLLVAAAIVLSTVAFAAPHASRDQVLAFLRHEGIISGNTRVVEATWNEDANSWFVSLRHQSGTISNWTVDADARDYHYVCKN